jgi:hypothetical protein
MLKGVIVIVPLGVILLMGILLLVPVPDLPQIEPNLPGISIDEMHIEVPAPLEKVQAPLSEHARTGHNQDAWNAVLIQQHMAAGRCKPKMYQCPGKDIDVVYCKENNGMALGLIIGRTVEQVITGFMAPLGYWQDRCH